MFDPQALRQLLDVLSDAVLVLDRTARVVFANTAALRLIAGEPARQLAQLGPLLGESFVAAVADALAAGSSSSLPETVTLNDGRRFGAALAPLDGERHALRLAAVASPPAPAAEPTPAPAMPDMGTMFWDAPFPVTLQDEHFKLIDANDAYLDFTGFTREQLVGTDPLDLQPPEDRALNRAYRQQMSAAGTTRLVQRRLVHADGRERWFRAAWRVGSDAQGRARTVSILQDSTAEHIARERADRSVRELDDWFELSPVGMVLFDDQGLLVRSNPAFEALAGDVPVLMSEASPGIQQLMAWHDGKPLPLLRPGSSPVETQAWVHHAGHPGAPEGTPRRLRSIVRCYQSGSGQRRYMAIVEDRSVEEERDLAQMQIGALMDTAGVGLATFQESSGWVQHGAVFGGAAESVGGAPALQSIRRDVVLPESLPEYDKLQQALRLAQRAEVRYAIRHPEHGLRWLLTRVEPATLASGKRTTSVVTLDITDQHQTQQRSEMLLRELTTILESTTVGIAYLRGNLLVRCNRRFEVLLGFRAGDVAGCSLHELLAAQPQVGQLVAQIDESLAAGRVHETEIAVDTRGRPRHWCSLSVRRAGEGEDGQELIAVLTDITRLKAQQAELEALASEVALQAERTRAILDSVLVGIVTVGTDGIEWMNRSARRMFGGDLEDFIGRPMATVATPEPDHPFLRTEYLDDLVEGQAETFECRVKARDGREYWVVGNAVVTGRQLTYALLDIERRRQAEARIAEAQSSLQRIIEAAPLAITLRDAHTLRILQVNEVAARNASTPAALLIGRTPEQIFTPEVAAERRRDMEDALAAGRVTQREYRTELDGQFQVWDARYLPLSADGQPADQLLMVATEVTEQRAAQEARFEAAIAQREMLVKEVHHRIKNNLQGVAGLLQQIATRKPEVAGVMAEVVGQVQAIAQVYGLQVGMNGPLGVRSVLEAITGSVQRTFGRTIVFDVQGPQPQQWTLPEAESIPIALTVNELLTNAIKHSTGDAPVSCTLVCADDGVQIVIGNEGRLSEGFSLAQFPGGVSGLGLVRALLPRRSAKLSIEAQGTRVVAVVALKPPGVALSATIAPPPSRPQQPP
jgi:PAS domain S-box-containing protein